MNMKKVGKISLGILGGLILVILLTVLFWLGPTVKVIAQNIGTKALGTPLTIDSLSINPRNGTVHLSGFSISNQDSFNKSNAVSLASLDIAIDMGSIFSSTVIVHEVSLNSPHFIYEQGDASDNITEFILNVQEFVGFDPDAPPVEKKKKTKKKKSGDKDAKVVIVEALELNDVQLHLAHTFDDQLDIGVGFEQLSVSMTNGLVQLDGVYVRNPGRLNTPNLFSLDQLSVELEPGSIYTSNITIQAVHISNPQVFIEHNPETDTIGELLKVANNAISRMPTNAAPTTETNTADVDIDDEPTTPAPEVNLETLRVEGLRLNVVNTGDPTLNVYFGIDEINAALTKGNVSIKNIHVTNPKRLATPNLFSLEKIGIDFDAETLTADTFVLQDIQIRKPYAFLELNKEANTVGEFMKIADGFISRVPTYQLPEISSQPTTETAAGPEPKVSDAPPPIELHNLQVDDIEIQLLDTSGTNDVPDQPHMMAGIESVSVKLEEGKIAINNIAVPNVKGFTASNMFHLANIDIVLEPGSHNTAQTIINKIFVNAPEINLEQTKISGNVTELQTTLSHFAPPPTTAKPEPAPTETAEVNTNTTVLLADQPVILHELQVTNLAINLILPVNTNENTRVLTSFERPSFNPMSYVGEKDTNSVDAANGPMTLVAFDNLTAEPLKGLLYVDELRITNPKGFANKYLVSIQQFRLDIDPDTVQSDTFLIEDILIDKPRIAYERKLSTDNIKALQAEIEKAVNKREEYVPADKPEHIENGASTNEAQKIIIDHLLVQNGIVRAKISALPSAPIPLPKIEINGLGRDTGGTSLSNAGSKLYTAFYDAIIGSVSSVTGFAGDALKGVGSLTKGAVGGVKPGANATEEAVKDTAETVKKKSKKRRGAGGRRRF